MTLTEIAYRGRQQASKWIDRVHSRSRSRSRNERLRRHELTKPESMRALERFRCLAPEQFFAGAAEQDLAALLGERLPGVRDEVLGRADRVASGAFDLLGYRGLSFGDPVDWHLDPVAGRRSPLVHWSAIDPLDADAVGDSKVIWELNRHQWLVTLAQAYRLTGRERYLIQARTLFDSWLVANPPGVGINWASSLEVSLRLMAWCWTAILLKDTEWLSASRFAEFVQAVDDHARHIERFLSYYFSPNTHLTGEALGLFHAGVLFSDLRGAERWRTLGRQILISEARRQILDDGVYAEQATGYHCYTIEIYLHFLMLSDRCRIDVPPSIRTRVERMFDFLLTVCRDDGTIPAIGDSDGGQLLPLTGRQAGDCRGLMALGAACFGRSDLSSRAGAWAPEVAWLLGKEGTKRFPRPGSTRSSEARSRLFPSGGYAVMRASQDDRELKMIVDVGPLASDPSGAHGHADLLSIQCSASDDDFLVDAGTGCYTPDRAWRDFFRSSGAHSTVVIDDLSQADPDGPFSWRGRPAVRLRTWESNAAMDFVDAEHDAYTRLPDPVIHRRRVLFVKPRYWVVVDDLSGQAEHRVALLFQCGPEPVTDGISPWTWLPGRDAGGMWVMPVAAEPMAAAIQRGQVSPIRGWRSSVYGERHPSPVLVFSGERSLPLRIATLVIPVGREPSRPPRFEVIRGNDEQVAAVVLHDHAEVIRIDENLVSVHSTSCAAS